MNAHSLVVKIRFQRESSYYNKSPSRGLHHFVIYEIELQCYESCKRRRPQKFQPARQPAERGDVSDGDEEELARQVGLQEVEEVVLQQLRERLRATLWPIS